MNALTNHQRELALHRIALAIGWDALQDYQKKNATITARVVLAELERGAIHGASEKRALEAVLEEAAS